MFSRSVDYCLYRILKNRCAITRNSAQILYGFVKYFVDLSLTLKTFTGNEPLALMVFLANYLHTYNNCGICENEFVQVLAYSKSDGRYEMYEAYS